MQLNTIDIFLLNCLMNYVASNRVPEFICAGSFLSILENYFYFFSNSFPSE